MGTDYTASHAASLVATLPRDSRIARAEHPELEWAEETYVLAAIKHGIDVLVWQNTEDARHKRGYPKPMRTPADRARELHNERVSTPERMARVADALGLPPDRR